MSNTRLEITELPDSFYQGRLLRSRRDVPQLSAEDKFEILDLVYRFEWCFDGHRLDQLEHLLTDDVVTDHIFGYFEGKKAVVEMLRDLVPYRGLRHQSTNAVLFADDDGTVSVVSFLVVIQVGGKTPNSEPLPLLMGHGVVTDVVRHVNGEWKIAKRTFEQMKGIDGVSPNEDFRTNMEGTARERAARRTKR